jgi:hypothetical protein
MTTVEDANEFLKYNSDEVSEHFAHADIVDTEEEAYRRISELVDELAAALREKRQTSEDPEGP